MSEHFAGPDMPLMLVVVAMAPDSVEGNVSLADFEAWRDQQGGDLRYLRLDV